MAITSNGGGRAQVRNKGTVAGPLSTGPECATIRRKVAIFSQLVRHLTAIIYLVAELVLGFKPEKL
jgi:hypothetical protein